jgi:hypothetical protein
MTTAWVDWTFFLIVLFPVTVGMAAGAVWAVWVFSASADRTTRIGQRGCSFFLAAVCVTGTMASFTAWWIGFDYAESPGGVPERIDTLTNTGWAFGLAGLAALMAFAVGSFVHRAIRVTTRDAVLQAR